MGLIGWIKRRALKRTLKAFLGGHVDKIKTAIGFLVNFGGILEGQRTQIVFFVALALQVLKGLGVTIPVDEDMINKILLSLIGLFGSIKVQRIAASNGTE